MPMLLVLAAIAIGSFAATLIFWIVREVFKERAFVRSLNRSECQRREQQHKSRVARELIEDGFRVHYLPGRRTAVYVRGKEVFTIRDTDY